MTESIVSLCKIFYGNTDESNFTAKGNIVMPLFFSFLVRLSIKAKKKFTYLLLYINSVQPMMTSVIKKWKVMTWDIRNTDVCIKF